LSTAHEVDDAAWLADMVGYIPEIEPEERKDLLTILGVEERLKRAHELLSEQVEVLELKSKISNEVQKTSTRRNASISSASK
jgi:ATP-dependent Lon protease